MNKQLTSVAVNAAVVFIGGTAANFMANGGITVTKFVVLLGLLGATMTAAVWVNRVDLPDVPPKDIEQYRRSNQDGRPRTWQQTSTGPQHRPAPSPRPRQRSVRPRDGAASGGGIAGGIPLRLFATAFTLWILTLVLDGIRLTSDSVLQKIFTLLAVAAIFGMVNSLLRPIIKVVGCGLYVVTLGLIAVVVNGGLFLLTSWIAGKLGVPFHVDDFWPSAALGALVIGVVSWLVNILVPDGTIDRSQRLPR